MGFSSIFNRRQADANDVVDQRLHSLEEWNAWSKSTSILLDKAYLQRTVAIMTRNGIVEPMTGMHHVGRSITFTSDLRESILVNGLNSRMRASLYVLNEKLESLGRYEAKIYAAEAITNFASILRGRYPKFIGSEFSTNEATKEWLYPIPIKDLTALELPSDTFHVAVTNEVLEHVPDLDAALREICRVLKPGGQHIGTCPFIYNSEISDLRTVIQEGELVHLKPKEIHGDPVDAAGGSLVFETPAWDIMDRAKAAGFSSAYMRYIHSVKFGISCSSAGGVFVLCLEK